MTTSAQRLYTPNPRVPSERRALYQDAQRIKQNSLFVISLDRLPRRILPGQEPPGTAALQDVEDGI